MAVHAKLHKCCSDVAVRCSIDGNFVAVRSTIEGNGVAVRCSIDGNGVAARCSIDYRRQWCGSEV